MTQDLNYATELVFTGLFVDVGENMSVLDRINLTFVYDEIGLKGKSSEEEENAVSFWIRNANSCVIFSSDIVMWILLYCTDTLSLCGSSGIKSSLRNHKIFPWTTRLDIQIPGRKQGHDCFFNWSQHASWAGKPFFKKSFVCTEDINSCIVYIVFDTKASVLLARNEEYWILIFRS